MLLTVQARLVLLNMTAKAEGNLTTLRLVRDFQRDLGFSEEELAALQFEYPEGGGLRWKNAVEPKEVAVGPELKKAVAALFKPQLDANKLPLEMLPIAELFVDEVEPKAKED